MIVDAKTKEVVYNGEEWVWVRRKQDDVSLSSNACMSWLIQRKNMNKSQNIPCSKRVRKNGRDDNRSDVVYSEKLVECSECEAYNYWKPQINYQIY